MNRKYFMLEKKNKTHRKKVQMIIFQSIQHYYSFRIFWIAKNRNNGSLKMLTFFTKNEDS
jgi:hypothetical protein